eukprot:gene25105-10746_t
MPVVVQPPEAPMSEEQLAAKAKAEKGKKPAPPPKTPPKAGKGAPPPEEPKPTVEPGSLKVQIGIAANVTWRDWIRSGLKVRVYRTRMEAVRKPKPIEEEEAESVVKTPEKGKKPEKKAKPAAAEPELLGIGSLKTSDLVNGSMYNCGDSVPIVPKPALFDGKGIRMALEDERHPTQPKASLKSKMRLHVVPKSFGVDEETDLGNLLASSAIWVSDPPTSSHKQHILSAKGHEHEVLAARAHYGSSASSAVAGLGS